MSTDWMPGRRDDQMEIAEKWLNVLPTKKMKLGVTDAEIAELRDMREDVQLAIAAQHAGARGDQVLAAQTTEAFHRMVAYMRSLRRRRFFNSPMDTPEWLALGLRPPDTIRTDHVNVTEEVDFILEIHGQRQVHIRFWQEGMAHMAKPAGYDGAVVVWGVLDEPPTLADHLPNHTMASRTPHTLQFTEEERGKTVYVALCWQNERGNTGPWSDIKAAFIP